MNISVQLDVSYILCANFALALPVNLDIFTRATDKSGLFLEAIDVLGVRAKELLLLVKRADKMVRA